MRRRKPLAIATLSVVTFLLVAAAARFTPLWPGPALPAGATPMHIETASPHLMPIFDCPAGILPPVRVATFYDDLILTAVGTDDPVPVVWPSGWAAWRLDGKAELVSREGTVVAREGDVVDTFRGNVGTEMEIGVRVFHVCVSGG